jgi:hypothetical protein
MTEVHAFKNLLTVTLTPLGPHYRDALSDILSAIQQTSEADWMTVT